MKNIYSDEYTFPWQVVSLILRLIRRWERELCLINLRQSWQFIHIEMSRNNMSLTADVFLWDG